MSSGEAVIGASNRFQASRDLMIQAKHSTLSGLSGCEMIPSFKRADTVSLRCVARKHLHPCLDTTEIVLLPLSLRAGCSSSQGTVMNLVFVREFAFSLYTERGLLWA